MMFYIFVTVGQYCSAFYIVLLDKQGKFVWFLLKLLANDNALRLI